MSATIDDTYAEAFRSIYSEILITAKNRKWLDHAIAAATGNASSTIMCDCEAGLDRYVGPDGDQTLETPDARPGALVQFHVPRFKKDRVESLGKSLLMRISQNILTCPTTAVFSISNSNDWLPIGKKIAFFGDGYQRRDERFGRKVWIIPILGGEFVIDRRFYFQDGLMGEIFGSWVLTRIQHCKRQKELVLRLHQFQELFVHFLAESLQAGRKLVADINLQ